MQNHHMQQPIYQKHATFINVSVESNHTEKHREKNGWIKESLVTLNFIKFRAGHIREETVSRNTFQRYVKKITVIVFISTEGNCFLN